MILIKQPAYLTPYLQKLRSENKRIGFVPTMGALHRGHLALMEMAKKETETVVVSIFVNPTQFTNAQDFKHYPVTLEKDIEALLSVGCHLLFLPGTPAMYPPAHSEKKYEIGPIENRLEGFYRPGHFQGVCQAVDKLLAIIQPQKLFMGQKDYQQCLVIDQLLQVTGRKSKVELIIAKTVREMDGLAMSSRNLRLTETQRQNAPLIYSTLLFIKQNLHNYPLEELKLKAFTQLQQAGFLVDYVEIADAKDLSSASQKNKPLVALIAASLDSVRLIDNLPLN